jgi:hypothetical protein
MIEYPGPVSENRVAQPIPYSVRGSSGRIVSSVRWCTMMILLSTSDIIGKNLLDCFKMTGTAGALRMCKVQWSRSLGKGLRCEDIGQLCPYVLHREAGSWRASTYKEGDKSGPSAAAAAARTTHVKRISQCTHSLSRLSSSLLLWPSGHTRRPSLRCRLCTGATSRSKSQSPALSRPPTATCASALPT